MVNDMMAAILIGAILGSAIVLSVTIGLVKFLEKTKNNT